MPKTSVGVRKQKDMSKSSMQPTLTDQEKKAYNFYRYRIQKAKEGRNQPFRRFDNLTFLDDYYSNEDAINSYLRPKVNDDEVRVVGGLTENRTNSAINEMLSMNWQHEIHAFDDSDLEYEDLGRNIEDVVTRTNQIERDEDVREEILWELISQRAVFVEEIVEEKFTNGMYVKIARKRLKSSLQVFVGDITKPAYLFQEQPYIVEYERVSYWEAATIYDTDEWKAKYGDQWQYVRPGQNMDTDVFGRDYTFRLGILLTEEVEIIKYKSAPDNEYQIIINGVMMLPIGTELPWKHPGYNIACAVPKRMSPHFFYGRPMTAMLKYLQSLNDETVRNMIRKFRQAIQPPQTVEASNKVYSKDIWEAGKVTYGVPKNTFTKLVDHNGVTDSELAVYRVIVELQDELAARTVVQGGSQQGKRQTATAAIQQQQAAIKMLGLLILAYSRILRDLTYLRIYTILEDFTDPVDRQKDEVTGKRENVYRQYTVKDTVLENNKRGNKIVRFFHRDLTPEEEWDLMKYEDDQEHLGNNVRMAFLNVKKLVDVPKNWYVVISSKPKENDDLHKLMLSDKFEQVALMKNIMPDLQVNSGKAAAEFEQIWRSKDFFQKPEEIQAQQMQQMGEMGMQEPNQDVANQANEMLGKLQTMRGNGALNGIRAATRRPASPETTQKAVLTQE